MPIVSPELAHVESIETSAECQRPSMTGRQMLGSFHYPLKCELGARKQFKPPACVERVSPGKNLVICLVALEYTTCVSSKMV